MEHNELWEEEAVPRVNNLLGWSYRKQEYALTLPKRFMGKKSRNTEQG